MRFFTKKVKPDGRTYEETRLRVGRIVMVALATIVGLVVLFGSFYTVPAGHQAVEFSRFSGVKEGTTGPGMHMKMPLFESVTRYEVRSLVYTTEAIGASKDLQEIHAEIAVQYHPDAAYVNWLHQNVGPDYADRLIVPAVQESVKAATAEYLAVELITQRTLVKANITDLLMARLSQYHISVQQTSITDFDFSDQFNAAIEAKVTAEQRAQEEFNRLKQVEYQTQQRIVEAQGQAEAARLIAEQLRQDQNYLQYLWLQKWDGKLPSVMTGAGAEVLVSPSDWS